VAGASNSFDMSAMHAWFDKAVAQLEPSRELTSAIGMAMVMATQRRFKDGEDPQGHPWKQSAMAAKKGGQTLVDGAHLRDSITYEASAHQVVWGTNRIYGAIHQFGGKIEAKNAPFLIFETPGGIVMKKSVIIPKREYLGWNDDDLAVARDLVTEFMKQGMGVA